MRDRARVWVGEVGIVLVMGEQLPAMRCVVGSILTSRCTLTSVNWLGRPFEMSRMTARAAGETTPNHTSG